MKPQYDAGTPPGRVDLRWRRSGIGLAAIAVVAAIAGFAVLGATFLADARDFAAAAAAAPPKADVAIGVAPAHGEDAAPAPTHGDSAGALEFRFFDVGQGDAALVIAPGGRKVLIDAGPSDGAIVTRLRAAGIDTLDLVVASHNHADHIGGMVDVINTFVVRNYMENGLPHTTATYARVVAALERRRVPVLRAIPRSIDLGGGATASVLPMSARDASQNNRSVGLLLRQGSFTALFTGDAEVSQRRFWIDSAGLPRIHLLKVSHHGAANGTDVRWVAALRPCVAIIPVGRNSYGHPAPSTLDALNRAGARVVRTDESGDVVVRFEAESDVALLVHASRGAKRDSAERIRCEPE